MTRFYSQSTGCTYLPHIHRKSVPADAVEISELVYLTVIANPVPGKIRSHIDGLPILVDPPATSFEELVSLERQWRDAELQAVAWLRERHRDQLDGGAETTLTAEQFSELLVYIQALRDWPQSQAFPAFEQRPVAPPWVAQQNQ